MHGASSTFVGNGPVVMVLADLDRVQEPYRWPRRNRKDESGPVLHLDTTALASTSGAYDRGHEDAAKHR